MFKSVLLATFVAAAVSGCGAQEVDIAAVEEEITSEVKRQSDVSVTVDCPSQVDWEVGRTFNCIVEADDGSRATAEVTMENDEGEVTWRVV